MKIRRDCSRLIGLSDAENSRENKAKAVEYLTQAHNLAETIEQFSIRSTAFIQIAERFDELEETAKMREILTENLQTIFEIKDQVSRTVSLANLSGLYNSGEIKYTEEELEILKKLVKEAGRLQDAFYLVKTILNRLNKSKSMTAGLIHRFFTFQKKNARNRQSKQYSVNIKRIENRIHRRLFKNYLLVNSICRTDRLICI